MDFNDTPEEAAWRKECRTWLEANAPRKKEEQSSVALFGEMDTAEYLARSRDWQAKKFDAGYANITWPEEYGGRNGTAMERVIFGQEEGHFDTPTQPFMIGLGMIAPTILRHGTDAQKDRFLRKMWRGEEIWCQLFSEPGAGSDFAGLSTMAVSDGDEFVLNGQKVWTSGAQYSQFGEIICRTDPEAPKHRGLTAFIVPMDAEGITVRPLRQMTGGASFNEVFFDDVRVPAANVVGEVNQGWTVALTTFMNERVTIGAGGGIGGGSGRIIDLAKQLGKTGDPLVRQDLAEIYTMARISKFNGMRTLTAISKGGVPGPEGSLGKLTATLLLQKLADVAMALVGPAGTAEISDVYDWNQLSMGVPGMRVAGGTDEVMKNIVGEMVLGLPKEPRLDKGPWKDVPRSA